MRILCDKHCQSNALKNKTVLRTLPRGGENPALCEPRARCPHSPSAGSVGSDSARSSTARGPGWQQHGEGPAQPSLPGTPRQPSCLRVPPSAPSRFVPTPCTHRPPWRWQLPATREHLGCRKCCSFKIWLQSKLEQNQQGRNPNNLLFSKLNTGLPEQTASPPGARSCWALLTFSSDARGAGAGQ